MTIAFIIALIVAIVFIILWSEEKDKRVLAEQRIRQLNKEIKKAKSKTGVSAVEKSRKTKEYVILRPPQKKDTPQLDQSRLAELKEQTKAAQDMLAEIFIHEDGTVPETVENSNTDNLHKNLKKLLAKDLWTRGEIEELVGRNVMIGNLLEQINDYAYSKINDIVVEEDGDKIHVTTGYKKQLI